MKTRSRMDDYSIKPYRLLAAAMALVLLGTIASLACDTSKYQKSHVTYYEQTYTVTTDSAFDSRCEYFTNVNGVRKCRIRMVGELYRPNPGAYSASPTGKFPAIIFNHGSERDIDDNSYPCVLAQYYVPKGFIVFFPFRRGHGNDDQPNRRSTGIYINDFVDDFIATDSPYRHPTTCGSSGPVGADACYRQELFAMQANQEIREAMDYLKDRPDVPKKGNSGDYRIAITGSSYGGQVTTYANTLDLGQAAAVIFSPAAHEWGIDDCSPNEIACGTYTRQGLMNAAAHAHRPAFYLQSRWDVDTRPTMNLPFAHGMSSPDASHARVFRSAIFNWTGGICSGPDCTEDQLNAIHGSFCTVGSVWGPEVLPFLETYGVK